MADEHLTAKDARFVLISMPPDVCWTPIGDKQVPLPYAITHRMDQSQQCSDDVYSNGKPVFLHRMSYVDNVKGDEPGMGGGVITGVNMKVSHSLTHSRNVYVNGHKVVRTGDLVHMNTRKP